ncbi:MAG: hypothetical protein GX921_07860 [Bacteroidales bacterium]|nr:hypothetical protein [Bacteroidales bacterium]
MSKLKFILFASLTLIVLSFACASRDKSSQPFQSDVAEAKVRKARFLGNYNREFNDFNDLHMSAAVKNGITPLETRADTVHQMDMLVRLPDELDLYRQYDITHSIPYLVPSAVKLFIDIAQNFRDSLYSKEMPLHKIYLTSITRTDEDTKRLIKRNINASSNSAHRYGTTIDISWKRFDKLDLHSSEDISPDKLKLVLAQVLFDLKNDERCYVKHERRQACFHITVRD